MIHKMISLDWRSMKYYQIRGLLLPIVAFFAGVIYSPIVVIPFLTFIGVSYSVNPFAVEEKGELNNLYLTLPIKRSQIVAGRYALSFIIVLSCIIIGVPIMILSNTISFSKYYIGINGMASIVAFSFFMYSVFNLSMFPTLFKLGYQKGKMWGFYIPAILFAILFAGYYVTTLLPGKETLTIDFIVYATNHMLIINAGFIISAAALLFVSFMISTKLYSERNF